MRGRDVDAVRLRARSGSVKQPESPQELLLEPPQEHLLEPPSQLILRESTPRAISLTSDSSSVRSQGRRLMDEHEKHAEAGWLPQWVTSMYTSVPQTSLQEDTTEGMESMNNEHEYDNEHEQDHGLDIMNANLDDDEYDDEMGEDDDSTDSTGQQADSTPTTRRRLSSRRRSSLSCPSGQRVEQRAVTELECDSAGRTSCTYARHSPLLLRPFWTAYGTAPLSFGATFRITGVKTEITAQKWRQNEQRWARYGLF